MKISQPQRNAFTLIELLVVIAIIAILAGLAVPAITAGLFKGQITQTVNNARQLQLAGFQMANDGITSGDSRLGWPGDLIKSGGGGAATPGSTSAPVLGLKSYITALQTNGYLKPTDVIKITIAPGITPWNGTAGSFDGNLNCAFKIYSVSASDGASNLFAATRNFTYGQPLSTTQVPYTTKGFVVVQVGGSAIALTQNQAQSNQIIGLLPGRQDLLTSPAEGQNPVLQIPDVIPQTN
jgi:prepilin-type N-terminal cleavage/methylation domain-containing protein